MKGVQRTSLLYSDLSSCDLEFWAHLSGLGCLKSRFMVRWFLPYATCNAYGQSRSIARPMQIWKPSISTKMLLRDGTCARRSKPCISPSCTDRLLLSLDLRNQQSHVGVNDASTASSMPVAKLKALTVGYCRSKIFAQAVAAVKPYTLLTLLWWKNR